MRALRRAAARVWARSEVTGSARCEASQGFQDAFDVAVGQPVVPKPSLLLRGDEPAAEQNREMVFTVEAETPASSASRPAGSARPSASAMSTRTRRGSAKAVATCAISGSPPDAVGIPRSLRTNHFDAR